MIYTINILIILFIIGMAYWWAVQGFFSAFMHMLSVIVAGAIALALWEPIVYGLLMRGNMAHYAWCVGLIVPFIFLLIIIRLTLDRFVRRNMHFSSVSNYIGGGLFGGIAAYITAGIAMLAMLNLPFGVAFGGYQPLTVLAGDQNRVADNAGSSLFVTPETGTVAFYNLLSSAAFSSSRPMATHLPAPDVTAKVNRLRLDINASIVALPDSIQLERYFVVDPTAFGAGVPEDALDLIAQESGRYKLVAAEIQFRNDPIGTYDYDNALRIAPTQIQLYGTGMESRWPLLPVAYTRLYEESPVLRRIDQPMEFIASINPTSNIMWFFVAPTEFEPICVAVRGTRLDLTPDERVTEVMQLAAAMQLQPTTVTTEPDPANGGGTPTATTDAQQTGRPILGEMSGRVTGQVAKDYSLTAALPAAFSRNYVVGSARYADDNNDLIHANEITVRPGEGGHQSASVMVRSLRVSDHLVPVRIEFDRSHARSVLGAAVVTAGVQAASLMDDEGNQYFPVGYVWRKGDRSQQVYFRLDAPIRGAAQLPVRELREGETLHVYYFVPRGKTLTRFVATPQNEQLWEPPLKLPD